MPRTPTPTQAEMTRVMKAAVDAGLHVRECLLTKDGLRMIFVDSDKATDQNCTEPKEWPSESESA